MNPLNASEISLVQASFRKISRNGDEAASLFYTRLFEIDPRLRALTRADFAEQKRDFIRLLGTIVHRLDCFELIRDHLQDLALCHPTVTACDPPHRSIGTALFWMFEQVLGLEFTPPLLAAWMKLFLSLSNDLSASASRQLAFAN